MISTQTISDSAFGEGAVSIARSSIGRFEYPNESVLFTGKDKHGGNGLQTENTQFLSSLMPREECSR